MPSLQYTTLFLPFCPPQIKLILYRNALIGLASLLLVGCNEISTPILPFKNSFDKDNEGWRISEGGKGGFKESGGNPGGYLNAIDNGPDVWYYIASEQFVNKARIAYGLSLCFDLQQSAVDAQVDADDVILVADNIKLTFNNAYHPKTTWTSYTIILDELHGWKNGSVTATRVELQQVLNSLTEIRIRGEFRSGPDEGGLDNVSIH